MTQIKTYGVRGLMECVLNIPVGKANMKVEFSGGVLTAYGNTPAKYTTADPVRQAIIEHSPEFRSGKITLLRTIERASNQSALSNQTNQTDQTDQPDSSDSSDSSAPSLTPMTFSSLVAARDYLIREYSYSPSTLKDKTKITAAGRAHGLAITIS